MTKEQKKLLSFIRTALNGYGEMLEQCDEAKLVALCQEHGVAPLVMAAAQWYKNELNDKVLGTGALLQVYAAVEQQKKMMQQKKLLSLEFAEKLGLPCAVLKGLDYCRFWPDESWRGFGDLDVWAIFHTDCTDNTDSAYKRLNERAKEIGCKVEADGYYKHSEIFYKGLMIENHQFLTMFDGTKTGKPLEKTAENLITEEKTEIAKNLFAPSNNFTALFMLLHAHQHFFFEGLSLRQILDWHFFLKKNGDKVYWAVVLDVLEKAGMRGFYDVMTDFCVKHFGLRTSLPYRHDKAVLSDFTEAVFKKEKFHNKASELAYRYVRMWRFRKFLGENLLTRIKNTLVYNYLHKAPKLD